MALYSHCAQLPQELDPAQGAPLPCLHTQQPALFRRAARQSGRLESAWEPRLSPVQHVHPDCDRVACAWSRARKRTIRHFRTHIAPSSFRAARGVCERAVREESGIGACVVVVCYRGNVMMTYVVQRIAEPKHVWRRVAECCCDCTFCTKMEHLWRISVPGPATGPVCFAQL